MIRFFHNSVICSFIHSRNNYQPDFNYSPILSLKKQVTHTSGVFHLHCRWSPNCHLRFKHLWNYQFLLGVKLNENLQTFLDTPVSNHKAPEDTWGPSCMFLYIRYIVADSLRPHGLQHARIPCSSPSLGVCLNSRPLSWWSHPTMSFSVVPFSSCLWSFPASGSFPMSWLLKSGGQSIEASASASVLPMNIQDWFPSELTGLISLLSKWVSIVFSSITIWRHQFFSTQPFLLSSSHIRTWLLEKP